MIEPWQLLLFGGCLGTVAANLAVMLLVYAQVRRRSRRFIRLPRIGEAEVDDVMTAMAVAGFQYVAMRETADRVYTIWFQER